MHKKTIILIMVLLGTILFTLSAKAQQKQYAYVSVYDYTAVDAGIAQASMTGVILENCKVEIAQSTMQTIKNAFSIGAVASEWEGSYVKSINNLGEGKGYAGWSMSYNNDDYSNWGVEYITLKDGDTIRFDYSNNEDYVTDDIGNGFYGLPIVTQISLDGIDVKMSRTSEYDAEWNVVNAYYIDYANGVKEIIEGDGTEENPFIVNVPVKNETDITNINAVYKTSLNPNYRITYGIDEAADYTNGANVSISTLGGKYKSYYKIYAKKLNSYGIATDTNENGTKSYIYSNTDAICYSAFYNEDKSLKTVLTDNITRGVSLINNKNAERTYIWSDMMSALY